MCIRDRQAFWRDVEKGVPLDAAAADVDRYEVLARAQVDLVADGGDVVGHAVSDGREAGIARPDGRLELRVEHRAHLGPDAVGAHEEVGLNLCVVAQRRHHFLPAVLARDNLPPVLNAAAHPVEQDLLQHWPVDHHRGILVARARGRV
eukprot:6200695-Pleurochrysis_carterae.AAC.2